MQSPTESGSTEVLTVNIRIGNEAVADHWAALETLRDALSDILMCDAFPNDDNWRGIGERRHRAAVPTLSFSRHAMTREWPVRDANGNTVGKIQHVTHDQTEEVAR